MPRAVQETPPQITHDPRLRLTSNLRQTLPNPIEIAKQTLDTLLKVVKDGTGLDFANPFALVASIAEALQSVTGGIVSQIAAALTGHNAPGAGLADITAWAKGLPILGDVVEALTGRAGGKTDLEAWAQSLPGQAEQAAHQVVDGVNQLVGQLAHDAEQVGENLAATIAGALGLAHDAQAQSAQNTADITALSNIAPTKAVTSLFESTSGQDLPVFPRGLMMPIAKTASVADHSHVIQGGQGTNTGLSGGHFHTIATDAASYQPADKELALMLIRATRAQPVNAVKILTAATGWSFTDLDQLVVCCYALDGWTWKLIWQSTNLKNTVKTAASEYALPIGQELNVLPGHVLAVGVWQKQTTILGVPTGQTRKLAGIPLIPLASDPQSATPTMLARLRNQASIPAQFGAGSDSGLVYLNDMAVWAALTHL